MGSVIGKKRRRIQIFWETNPRQDRHTVISKPSDGKSPPKFRHEEIPHSLWLDIPAGAPWVAILALQGTQRQPYPMVGEGEAFLNLRRTVAR